MGLPGPLPIPHHLSGQWANGSRDCGRPRGAACPALEEAHISHGLASTSAGATGSVASRPFEIRSLPLLTHCFPRNFTFYVAHPIRSIREQAGTVGCLSPVI